MRSIVTISSSPFQILHNSLSHLLEYKFISSGCYLQNSFLLPRICEWMPASFINFRNDIHLWLRCRMIPLNQPRIKYSNSSPALISYSVNFTSHHLAPCFTSLLSPHGFPSTPNLSSRCASASIPSAKRDITVNQILSTCSFHNGIDLPQLRPPLYSPKSSSSVITSPIKLGS